MKEKSKRGKKRDRLKNWGKIKRRCAKEIKKRIIARQDKEERKDIDAKRIQMAKKDLQVGGFNKLLLDAAMRGDIKSFSKIIGDP